MRLLSQMGSRTVVSVPSALFRSFTWSLCDRLRLLLVLQRWHLAVKERAPHPALAPWHAGTPSSLCARRFPAMASAVVFSAAVGSLPHLSLDTSRSPRFAATLVAALPSQLSSAPPARDSSIAIAEVEQEERNKKNIGQMLAPKVPPLGSPWYHVRIGLMILSSPLAGKNYRYRIQSCRHSKPILPPPPPLLFASFSPQWDPFLCLLPHTATFIYLFILLLWGFPYPTGKPCCGDFLVLHQLCANFLNFCLACCSCWVACVHVFKWLVNQKDHGNFFFFAENQKQKWCCVTRHSPQGK